MALARYTTAGSLDTTFGPAHTGTTTVATGTIEDNRPARMLVQSDGKIVVAGVRGPNVAVYRITTAGVLDSTFGTGGVVTLYGRNMGADPQVEVQVAAGLNGKIVVSGANVNGQVEVDRLLANGTPDSTFGSSGAFRFVWTAASTSSIPTGLAVRGDGRVVVTGVNVSGTVQGGVEQLTAAGAPDGTFGTSGKVLLATGTQVPLDLALAPDGGAVLARKALEGGTVTGWLLTKLTSTGAPDGTFGTGGSTHMPWAGFDLANVLRVVIDGSNRVIVAGPYAPPSGPSSATVTGVGRTTAGGAADSTFGSGGLGTIDVPGGTDSVYAVALQTDEKILTGGSIVAGSATQFSTARFNG